MDEDILSLLAERRYSLALERLLDLYEKKVFRMALAFLRDPARAEEVTQDVFVKLWLALPDYDGRAAPKTWLYTIARNTCLSALRSESYRRTVPLEGAPEPAVPDVASGDAGLARCIGRLPGLQREVITMFYLQERSVDEVARMLDLPEGTVKSHLRRARVALASMLRE